MADGVAVEQVNNDVRQWEVEPQVIQTNTRSGKPVECVITPYLKKSPNALHIYNEQDGVQYDIPTEGDLNLVVNVNESGKVVPVGAMSLVVQEFVPTINMIQQVKASKRQEDDNAVAKDRRIAFGKALDLITHPNQGLIKGVDGIEWRKMLLVQGEKIAKENGFTKVRLMSGFSSEHLKGSYELTLAVQQYDRLVNSDKEWTPYNSKGIPINDPEQRKLLNSTIRKLRDGDLKTEQEVKKVLPIDLTPVYYQKNLK